MHNYTAVVLNAVYLAILFIYLPLEGTNFYHVVQRRNLQINGLFLYIQFVYNSLITAIIYDYFLKLFQQPNNISNLKIFSFLYKARLFYVQQSNSMLLHAKDLEDDASSEIIIILRISPMLTYIYVKYQRNFKITVPTQQLTC